MPQTQVALPVALIVKLAILQETALLAAQPWISGSSMGQDAFLFPGTLKATLQ